MEKNIDMDLFLLDATVNKLSVLLDDFREYFEGNTPLFDCNAYAPVFREQAITRINILNDYVTTLGDDITQIRRNTLQDVGI